MANPEHVGQPQERDIWDQCLIEKVDSNCDRHDDWGKVKGKLKVTLRFQGNVTWMDGV